MSMTATLFLVILAVLVAAAWALYLVIRRRLRLFSRAAFGTNSLHEGLERNVRELAETPKSVSAMTRIYLPQIQQDFPELSVDELKRKSENLLVSCFLAVTGESPEMLTAASPDLREQVRVWVENNRAQGIRERFEAVRIHQTEITRYKREASYCALIFQSSIEYLYGKQKSGGSAPELKKIQTRYNQEWMYVQDVSKLPSYVRVLALNCPNCGAPVTGLGEKVCSYCGSAVLPVNTRVWTLNKIEES